MVRFENRKVIYPNRYKLLNENDETFAVVEITRVPPQDGESLGTELSAEVMNAAFAEKQNNLYPSDNTLSISENNGKTEINVVFSEPNLVETDYSAIVGEVASDTFSIDKKNWTATLKESDDVQENILILSDFPYQSAYVEFTLKELCEKNIDGGITPSFAVCFNAEPKNYSVFCRFDIHDNKVKLTKGDGTLLDEFAIRTNTFEKIGVQRSTNITSGYNYNIFINDNYVGTLHNDEFDTDKNTISLLLENCTATVAYWKTNGKF